MELFIDGSKTKSGTGVGIRIGMYPTGFQWEITALMKCVWGSLRFGLQDKNICIYRESQVTLLNTLDSNELYKSCHGLFENHITVGGGGDQQCYALLGFWKYCV